MLEILIKSFTFMLIIMIGFLLKKKKILKKSDANVLATIIMNITLPCALLTSANGIELNYVILLLIAIGILSNVLMIIIGYIASSKESNIIKGTFMINTSGYNIGNFALPFVQGFFPGLGVAYLCSFDIGNALMCLGITYALASHVASGEGKFSIKELLLKLFSSIPFDTYIIIFMLSLFKLSIPSPILSIASTIGAGNSFLAMLMIGLMLEIKIPKKEIKQIVKLLSLRICGTILLSLIAYMLLPIPELAKKIVIMALFAPLSTVSAVFTQKIGYKGDLSATANSISIIISIICMTILLLFFH